MSFHACVEAKDTPLASTRSWRTRRPAILDLVLHHCTVTNIKGESYRLKERKEFMKQKQLIVNTLLDQGNS